jgi:hypothetical protein
MSKFPVFGTIKNSFKFIFENWRYALKVTWPYALFLVAMISLGEFAQTDGTDDHMRLISDIVMIIYFISLPITISMPSLLWQRAYLRGIHSQDQLHSLNLRGRQWRFIAGHSAAYLLFILAITGVITLPALASLIITEDPEMSTGLIFLSIITAAYLLLLVPLIISVRTLPKLAAIAAGDQLTSRESFKLTKGTSLRLAATLLLTAILFIGADSALNGTRMTADYKRAFEYGWHDEARENAREQQIANGDPVTVPEELPDKAEFMEPPPRLIDFLFYIPVNVILSLFSVLVAGGVLAQFYKWATDNRAQ